MLKPFRHRSVRAVGSWAALILIMAAWAVFLRPQFLGGPAKFVGVSGISMTPTMHDGDLALVSRRSTYHRGDVIAYHIPGGQPGEGNNIIHRVIGGDGRDGYVTRGDHNTWDDLWRPTDHDVMGRVVGHVPFVAMIFGELRRPWLLASVSGLATFVAVMWPWRRRQDGDETDEANEANQADEAAAGDEPVPAVEPVLEPVPVAAQSPVLAPVPALLPGRPAVRPASAAAGLAVTAAAVVIGLVHGALAEGPRKS